MTSLDRSLLEKRLAELLEEHEIPGAVLGVLHGDELVEAAGGLLNNRAGIETTTDSVFQIGSITKVWTATLVMMLVDDGVLDLDEPVKTYLPEFRVADPEVTERVTLRHLLSHSSGIGGDHILETGRGDDALERYLGTIAELGQEHELGATMSYCNTGYSVTGRVIEKVTGQVWDQVLRERLIVPLGLTRTGTLPEEAILHRVAVGHVKLPGQEGFQVAPFWTLPRSAGPAGLVNASVADLLTFARLHLDGGRSAAGTQLLSPESVALMQEAQIDVPDRFTLGDKWGVGWILFDWDGRRLYGHDGATVGQRAYLRVLPEPRLAVAFLTNGGNSGVAFRSLCTELFGELAGVDVPGIPEAAAAPPAVDLSLYAGTYQRLNVSMELTAAGGVLEGKVDMSGPLADMLPKDEDDQRMTLVPVDRETFLATSKSSPTPVPVVFFDFEGERPRRFHFGARAMTRTS